MRIASRLRLLVVGTLVATAAFVVALRSWNNDLSAELDDVRASRYRLRLAIAIEHNVATEVELIEVGALPKTLDVLAGTTRTAIAQLRSSIFANGDDDDVRFAETLGALQATIERSRENGLGALRAREDARNGVVEMVSELVRAEEDRLNESTATLERKEATVIAGALVLALVLTAVILLTVVAPMRRYTRAMIAATRRIAAGDLASPVAIAGPADLEELGRAVDRMRVDLHAKLGVEARLREVEELDRALASSEERYRTLFEMSPLPKWLYDSETLQITMCNQATLSLTGYRRAELEALKLDDLMVGVEAGLTRIRCKDGRVRELQMTAHTVAAGGRMCLLCVGVDVTETRRVEEQLRQVQKLEAVGRLAGGVAHDFNNILAVIQMNAELVGGDLGADHPSKADVREIKIAAERGARLTRQLLAFSRQQKIVPKPIVLSSLVGELEHMLRRVVGEDIQITLSQAANAGIVEADAGQLEQVIMNLVVNARDAMPDGGHLTLETGATDLDHQQAARLGLPAGSYCVLTVADTGCGMSEEVKLHVFEPFFTTKEVGKGTGLGLANVCGIVTQNRGAVSIESAVGCGSIFRVYLPRVTKRIEPSPTTAAPPLPVVRGATILVVEDEDSVRSAIRRLVTSCGYECIEARNGDMALDILRASRAPIDLMISDVVMPGMNGYSLAAQVQRLRPSVKVLMVSGHSEHPSLERHVGSEDHPFVAKPFSARTLTSAIRAVLADEPLPAASSAA